MGLLKEFRITVLLLFVCSAGFSQYRISGQITEVSKREIEGAEVYLPELNRLGSTTSGGYYEITGIPAGRYTIIVFAYEFQVKEMEVDIREDTEININIEPLAEELSEVILIQERERIFALKRLRTVEGTALYAGKKSEVVILDQLTANLAANNPRQIYNQVVGLNIYENGDAGLQLNIGGRGLDPNRTANFNTRQNGYDISADALGYPESYYTPPAEALSEIQVVRGAASLQYGPQFGGLVNFVFRKPNPYRKIEWISRQTLGSYGLLTSFNSLSGTLDDFSYYTYFNYKEGDGFRPNSNFTSRNYFGSFAYRLSDQTKLTFETTLQNYLVQQAGGLTDEQFELNPVFSNRARNWFEVDWKLFSLRLDQRLATQTDFSFNLFALDASRKSLGFRTNRVSQLDDSSEPRELLADNFQNWGAETRVLTRYPVFGKDAVLLLGSKYYHSNNDQRQGPGSNGSGPDFNYYDTEYPNYERQSRFDFPNRNLAVFGEHMFQVSDKLYITPGFRWEYIKTESKGSYRNIILDLAGNPLLNEEVPDNRVFDRNFFLLGIGASYSLSPQTELYGNISQNYRSVTFNDIRVVNPSFQIDQDIRDEDGFTADLGIRGKINNILSFDLSTFSLLYDNRLGEILKNETRSNANGELMETGRVVRFRGNIGTAFIYGLEGFADWNIKQYIWGNSDKARLTLFLNLALTNSEYLSSEENNVEGNKVEFISDVNLKTGILFGYGDLLGSLQYAYLSEQFTDATNAPRDINDNQRGIEGAIPAYGIMDLSVSYSFGRWKLETGVNNLLDQSYFTRRATGYPGPGIIPSEPRTFYTTLQVKL